MKEELITKAYEVAKEVLPLLVYVSGIFLSFC